MLVTIHKATVLTGRSRSTILRHIKQGKVSKTGDGIDTSELLRVYGSFVDTHDMSPDISHDMSMTHHESREAWLMSQIDTLNKQLADQKKESVEREQQYLEREKRLMCLLENQTVTPKKRFGFF
jgi:hypothetical protein